MEHKVQQEQVQQSIESCPAGTDQEGHFVIGDGNPTTTDELLPLCNLPDADAEVWMTEHN